MLHTRQKSVKLPDRRGAIVPLFAVLLPVLLIFCGFAINLAYMQVVTTELKIATDCAAHAGGRAMSVAQDDPALSLPEKRALAIDWGIEKAQELANANAVLGHELSVGGEGSGSDIEIGFGRSIRSNNGFGRYEYTELDPTQVANGNSRPSSLHVSGNLTVQLPFRVMGNSNNTSSFSPTRRSVATQVNRDVALVLDRSGSMLHFHDEDLYDNTIDELFNTVRRFNLHRYSTDSSSPNFNRGAWIEDGMPIPNGWSAPISTGLSRLISSTERNNAKAFIDRRSFSNNLIYQLERRTNDNHSLGLRYSESLQHHDSVDVLCCTMASMHFSMFSTLPTKKN